jgi:hypothetical protein
MAMCRRAVAALTSVKALGEPPGKYRLSYSWEEYHGRDRDRSEQLGAVP